MTHGDKAKAKKTASQASGSKKSSKAVEASKAAKSSKTGKSTQSGKEGGGKKAVPKAAEAPKKQQAGAKAAAVPKTGSSKVPNGKPAARGAGGEAGFSNPVIANAFKRAVKKFPNAFRRLTD